MVMFCIFHRFFLCSPEGIILVLRKSRNIDANSTEATETRAFSALALLDSALSTEPPGSRTEDASDAFPCGPCRLRGWFQTMNITLEGGFFTMFIG